MNIDELRNSNSYSIGRASPLLLLGIIFVVTPYLLNVVGFTSGIIKTIGWTLGIICILIGSVVSMIGR